jgi:hypothetical protein
MGDGKFTVTDVPAVVPFVKFVAATAGKAI